MTASVEAIFLTEEPGGEPRPVDRARAVAHRGLEGDRYFAGVGTFSERGGERALTLIEAEAIEGLARDTGIELGLGESRRNVVTRGVALNDLVGVRFRVGDVECVGLQLAEPCTHLEGLTQPGVLNGLVHRGGLRADILTDGEIAVGDAVTQVSGDENQI